MEARKLLAALTRLMPLVDDNPIMPALASVRMVTLADGTLMLTAGSLLQRLTLSVGNVDVGDGEEFSGCPEIQPLLRLIKTMEDVPVWLTMHEGYMELSSSVVQTKLPCFDAATYPRLTGLDGAGSYELELSEETAKAAAAAITRLTKFAGEKPESHPHFAGIWMRPHESGGAILEACNDTIVSDERVGIELSPDTPPFMLPHTALTNVAAALSATTGACTLQVQPSWLGVGGPSHGSAGNNQYWVRRLEADYPVMFPKLWPKKEEVTGTWTTEREALIASRKRTLALPGLPDKAPITHQGKLETREDEMYLSYRYNDYSLLEPVGAYEGTPLAWPCGFDVKRLLTLLASMKGENITIRTNAEEVGRKFLLVYDGTYRAICSAILYKQD